MAATLTADGELTFYSFPIEKAEETADGDLVVYGKATDGTVDADLQVVDPDWSAKAIQDWLSTGGNVRVQHQARRDPAGRGLAVEVTPDGHYVKALVVEPVAKELVRKQVLTAYSVGISHPDIRPDPTGKAVNGVITGRRDGKTSISEISLVDRGSNFNSRFQLVKAMGTGIEFVGKMLGEDGEDVLAIGGGSYKPSDLAALLAHKAAAAAIEKRSFDPTVGGGVDRDQLPASDFAGPDRSFPIVTPQDVHDAALSLGRTGHDPARVKSNIISIAHRKGQAFVDQLPDSWQDGAAAKAADAAAADKPCGTCGGKGTILEGHRKCPDCAGPAAGKVDEPDLAKKGKATCPGCGGGVSAKHAFCPGCGKKMRGEVAEKKLTKLEVRAALLKAADGADDVDDHAADGSDEKGKDDDAKPADTVDAGASDEDDGQEGAGDNADNVQTDSASDDEDDVASPKKGKAARAKVRKGKPTPGDAPGQVTTATAPAPAHREPDGPTVEAFEADAGLPTDPDPAAGKAADPELGAVLRLKTLGVPTSLGKLHDLTCPCYRPGDVAKAWPGADLADLDDLHWQRRAFDAVAGASLPEAAHAQKLWQHAVTLKGASAADLAEVRGELHKAFADANPGPGSAPTPSELSAQRFNRPYLSAGHAAASPGQAGPNDAPLVGSHVEAEQFSRGYLAAGHAADSPANKAAGRTYYTNTGRDQARQAMVAMHDHIAQTFPDLCPAATAPASLQPAAPPTPRAVPTPAGTPAPRLAAKAPDGADRLLRKARRRLEKAVLAGAMTLPEARARLADLTQPAAPAVAEKAAAGPADALTEAGLTGIIERAVAAAVAARDETHGTQLAKLEKRLKRQAELIEQLAEQPEPGGPYRGLAVLGTPQLPPAAAPPAEKSAERSRDALTRLLVEEWRTNPDPSQREAAWAEITKLRQ